MLIGRGDEILDCVPSDNLSGNPNRFLIDPHAHFHAIRRARAAGLDVIGFYHSHPHSSPVPSPTDIAEASYEHHFYAIVTLMSDPPALKIYWLDDGRFEEISS